MLTALIIIFVLGYLLIALEHPIKINKAATALIIGALIWAILALFSGLGGHKLEHELLEHLSEISSILFFLLGAMTIVELVDLHQGFDVITSRITTNSKTKLIWIVSVLTFFLSAVLDNLTTTIVMVTLLQKIISNTKDRLLFVGMVIISANAGGAWSPIGDVTTTMLWIGGQIETLPIIKSIIFPSIVCAVVPLVVLSFKFSRSKNPYLETSALKKSEAKATLAQNFVVPDWERRLFLIAGVLGLIFVPIFKSVTHLPPFMGMMFSLGILWIFDEVIRSSYDEQTEEMRKKSISVFAALRKVDVSSILFFLGILLAVGGLQVTGVLKDVAGGLDTFFDHNLYLINGAIGILSAIVDNVPLVAASMSMYDIASEGVYATNGLFWNLLTYSAGTGGSVLIIGSAAGVAAMGLDKVEFIWYLKNISWLALIGFVSGLLTIFLIA